MRINTFSPSFGGFQRRSSLRADPRHHIHTHTNEKMDRNLKYCHKQNQGENIPLHFVFIQEGILRHHDFFSLSLSLFACSFSHDRKLLNINAGIGAMPWLKGSGVTQQAALCSVSCVDGSVRASASTPLPQPVHWAGWLNCQQFFKSTLRLRSWTVTFAHKAEQEMVYFSMGFNFPVVDHLE